MTAFFFGLGLIFGYVSLGLGLLGLIEALIVLGLVLWQVRRYPERTGAYLVGLSLVPIVILGSIMSRMPACGGALSASSECYASITGPVVGAYAAVGLVGAVLLGLTLRRMFDISPKGHPDRSPDASP